MIRENCLVSDRPGASRTRRLLAGIGRDSRLASADGTASVRGGFPIGYALSSQTWCEPAILRKGRPQSGRLGVGGTKSVRTSRCQIVDL